MREPHPLSEGMHRTFSCHIGEYKVFGNIGLQNSPGGGGGGGGGGLGFERQLTDYKEKFWFLSRRDMTWAVVSDIKPIPCFLPYIPLFPST